ASSLWHGMTTLIRFPRYMRSFSLLWRSALRDRRRCAAGRERGACRLAAGEPSPRLPRLQARPLLQDGRHHAGVEQDVDGEEALVGAEAFRLADEAARLLRLLAEPDLAEIVTRFAHVPELAVDEQLARIDVAVGEHRAAEVPGVAGNLVLVRAHDLRDQ